MSLLNKTLLNTLTSSVNRLIGLDPAAAARLEEHEGARFLISCTQPQARVYLDIEHRQLQLHSASDANRDWVPDTTLEASASAMLKLLLDSNPATLSNNPDLTLRGDYHAFSELIQTLKQLDIDYEALVASAVGDVPAHALGQLLRYSKHQLSTSSQTFKRHVSEFLKHEIQLVPSAHDMQQFSHSVTQLQRDSERLAAKLDRLAQRTAANSST